MITFRTETNVLKDLVKWATAEKLADDDAHSRSKVIEAVLNRFPMPVIHIDPISKSIIHPYFSITIILNFMSNDFRLEGIQAPYNGNNWETLPRNFQRRIEETAVTIVYAEHDADNDMSTYVRLMNKT